MRGKTVYPAHIPLVPIEFRGLMLEIKRDLRSIGLFVEGEDY